MADNQLIDLSRSFAIDIIRLCENINQRGKATAVSPQLLRSGTSIGANIHEANYASSRADFINKMQIALKECYESDYWLSVFHEAGIITDAEHRSMYDKCSKIRRILIASITTAKKNAE